MPVNSSWMERLACFRHTASSCLGQYVETVVRPSKHTVGTVKNMTTNCSWLRTGCRTSALVKRARPFLRFSRKVASAAIGLPLTKKSQYVSRPWQDRYLLPTLLGGNSGNCLKGYRLCRQSSNQTKSLYRRTTFVVRLELATS